MNTTTPTDDGRLGFDQAVAHVLRTQQAAFTVTPIFGDRVDEEMRAEGARVMGLLPSDPRRCALAIYCRPLFLLGLCGA